MYTSSTLDPNKEYTVKVETPGVTTKFATVVINMVGADGKRTQLSFQVPADQAPLNVPACSVPQVISEIVLLPNVVDEVGEDSDSTADTTSVTDR
jgi:hypothetical protein